MRGTIARRGDAWRLRVDAGRDPLTGARRRITRTVHGSRRQAETELARLVGEVANGTRQTPAGITVARLMATWIDMSGMEASTRYQAERRVARYVEPKLGRKPIRKVTALDLDQLYRELHRRGGTGGRPLSPATVRRVHVDLSAAFAQAVRWSWLTANPAASACPPAVRQRRPKAPTPAELRTLLAAALDTDPDLVEYLRLAAVTGARRGELCALRWSDVDLELGQVAVERALAYAGARTVYEKTTKADDDRPPITLDPATVTMLAARHLRARERALSCGIALPASAHVFSYDVDGASGWQPSGVTHRFARIRADVVLEHVQLRQLRHFVGTYLTAAAVPARAVADRLGHARPTTTLTFYAGAVPDVGYTGY